LARRFRQVLDVLKSLGYVADWSLTSKGERLTGVYNESDLLVVEALEAGILEGLDPAELGAVVSTLVYEARGPEPSEFERMPTPESERSWRALHKLWLDIRRREDEHGIDLTREPDPGFAERAYAWTAGEPLADVLDPEDAPGDFVRSVKQLVDLLRQLAEVAPDDALAKTVRQAIESLHRGVVAHSSLDV
jgi:ATP-dependent RNA helicase HelY